MHFFNTNSFLQQRNRFSFQKTKQFINPFFFFNHSVNFRSKFASFSKSLTAFSRSFKRIIIPKSFAGQRAFKPNIILVIHFIKAQAINASSKSVSTRLFSHMQICIRNIAVVNTRRSFMSLFAALFLIWHIRSGMVHIGRIRPYK